MNIYISSTLADLAEYRAQVTKSLQQIGHKILQMENYTAEETRPLYKCVKHTASADLYIGIFAWRYGHIPKPDLAFSDLPSKIIQGETSITEAEYYAAEKIPRLIFLLADSVAWPPTLMDAHTDTDGGKKIRDLRAALGENHLVAFFTSPDHLAREVMAAVRREELSTQLELKSLQAVDAYQWMMNPESPTPYGLSSTTMGSITEHIQKFDDETYMIINLGNGRNWWSTRLYFLASLLVDLTDIRLLVFVDGEKHLFGVSNALAVRNILSGRIPAVRSYEECIADKKVLSDLEDELNRRGEVWETEMQKTDGEGEVSVKTWVRKQELRRFLGDSLIQRAIEWSKDDNGQGGQILEIIDQIIKWPQDLVPLVRDGKFYKVVLRDALTEEVASIFVNERLRTSI